MVAVKVVLSLFIAYMRFEDPIAVMVEFIFTQLLLRLRLAELSPLRLPFFVDAVDAALR